MNIRNLIPDQEDIDFIRYLFENAGNSTNIKIFDEQGNIEYEWKKRG